MTHSRPRIGGARKPVAEVRYLREHIEIFDPPEPELLGIPPKSAGVRKPRPRAKPIANTKTAARSTTRGYALQAAVAPKDEASEESNGSAELMDVIPIQHKASQPKASVPHPTILKSSALPAPTAPAKTETEIENLMTIGRNKVEQELRDRIKEEKEKNSLLEKQTTTFENYKKYLAKLKDLGEELTELKEENRLNEDTVADLAEDFRESTMEWAKLFEKYAGDLGISVLDIRRLADAW